MAILITASPPIPNTLADNRPDRLFHNKLMLIRVVLAVNDFILPAGFSGKSLRGGVRRGLPRHFFVERGDAGEGRALSVVLSTSRPGFGLALQEAMAFALAFSLFLL